MHFFQGWYNLATEVANVGGVTPCEIGTFEKNLSALKRGTLV